LPDTEARAKLLTAVARRYADEGQYDQAFQGALMIEDASAKAEVVTDIARGELTHEYPKVELNEKATAFLSPTNEIWQGARPQDLSLADIALEYAVSAQYDRASIVAQMMANTFLQALTLTEIAGTYVEKGQAEKAAQPLSQALTVAGTIGNAGAKAQVLAAAGLLYVETGQSVDEDTKKVLHETIARLGERRTREQPVVVQRRTVLDGARISAPAE